MKKLLFILSIFLFVSCGGSDDNESKTMPDADRKAKMEQLVKYQKEVAVIKTEIYELNKKAQNSTGGLQIVYREQIAELEFRINELQREIYKLKKELGIT